MSTPRPCKADGNHVAVDQIGVAAFLLGNRVQIFQFPDVVGGHPAVLPGDGVALHAGFVIAPHEAVQIELHIKAPATGAPGFFVVREKSAIDGLFNPHQPWPDGMDGKGDVLRFDVGEGRPVQIADHVRRHTKDTADFRNLKLSRFQELCLVVGQAQRNEGHSLFQHSHAAGVAGAAIGSVPAGPQRSRVFDCVRVCQDTRWAGHRWRRTCCRIPRLRCQGRWRSFSSAMGLYPTMPSKPRPGTCSTSLGSSAHVLPSLVV